MDFKKKKGIFYIFTGIMIAAVLVYFFFDHYFFVYTVKGHSMENTLEDGDRIFVRKLHGDFSLERFDIVLLKKILNRKSRIMVKRVIGLPGEKIEIEKDKVFVNGKPLAEMYIGESVNRVINRESETVQSAEIVQNCYFLMGDNRTISKDSRDFGLIRKKDIVGRVLFSYWPFKKVR